MTILNIASCCSYAEGKTEVAEDAAEGTTINSVVTIQNIFLCYSEVIKVFAICLKKNLKKKCVQVESH